METHPPLEAEMTKPIQIQHGSPTQQAGMRRAAAMRNTRFKSDRLDPEGLIRGGRTDRTTGSRRRCRGGCPIQPTKSFMGQWMA